MVLSPMNERRHRTGSIRGDSTARLSSRTFATAAFTLVEALVAIALAGLVASTLLLSTYSGLSRATDTYESMVARGIAEQVMDEVMGQPYREQGASPYQWPLGPESNDGTAIRPGARNHFDDLDDYHGYEVKSPMVDAWGIGLTEGDGKGSLRDPNFQVPAVHWDGWMLRVLVGYVAEGSWDRQLPAGQTSDYRSVTVIVEKAAHDGTRELARVRRVVGYIPGNN